MTNEDGVQSFYHTKVISVHPENETDASSSKQNLVYQKTPRMDSTRMRNSGNAVKAVEGGVDDSSTSANQ